MLLHLDRVLFPNRCEVIEIIPSQRYVYAIFKNGYSSFTLAAKQNKWPIRINEQIQKIANIDIIIRNPKDRLISGINTFIQNSVKNNPTLDSNTVQWFALNYLYLDRHYCSQFLWLLNLARYLNADATLNFLPMAEIGNITNLDIKPKGVAAPTHELIDQVTQIKNNEMYQRIDQTILECIGQTMTFNQLLQNIKVLDPAAYDYVVVHAQQILKPTYALP